MTRQKGPLANRFVDRRGHLEAAVLDHAEHLRPAPDGLVPPPEPGEGAGAVQLARRRVRPLL